jgi:hypothetical protein
MSGLRQEDFNKFASYIRRIRVYGQTPDYAEHLSDNPEILYRALKIEG